MGLSKLYNKLALTSPYVEVMLRHLYWKNVTRLGKYNPNKATRTKTESNSESVDFDNVIKWLQARGVGKGDLLIVHSGYGELEKTGLSPDEIINCLLNLIGPTGTLAMPVIRRFKDLDKARKDGADLSTLTFKYNVKKTMITSGMLPYTLMQHEGAVVSHHPFNPLCAVGPLAKAMMEHNLEGEAPSPHGSNSAWKYAYDHGAKVCSIGTDIEHHNTIMHVVEEGFGDWFWPDDFWYDTFQFEVIDEHKQSQIVKVSNRKDEWGKKHIAEINVCNAEKKAGAMFSDCVDGITVGFVNPLKMVELLKSKNKKGYPYFLLPFEKAKNVK